MASSNIVTLGESNFAPEVVKSNVPVLVDFWAVWCGPCKMIAPILDELADEFGARIKIGKVNVDENQSLATAYGIRAIPTLLLFNGGEVVDQVVGMKSKRELQQMLQRVVI